MQAWQRPVLHARVEQLAGLAQTVSGRAAIARACPALGHVAGVFTADGEADLAAVVLADLAYLVGEETLRTALGMLLEEEAGADRIEALLAAAA